MPERRKFPRKKRRLTVEFHWNSAECMGFTYDISPTGIFVRSIRIPRVGTRLKITLHLPNEKAVPLVGAVIRSFRVPTSLARAVPSGFCIKLLGRPPEDYLHFLAAL